MLVAAAAMAFSACQKQESFEPGTAQEVMLTFTSEKPAFADETKTEWTGSTVQWSEGDKISIAYTVDGEWMGYEKTGEDQIVERSNPKLYKSDPLTEATEVAKFNVSNSFNIADEGAHIFYGVYPAPSATTFDDAPVANLSVPAIQTPGASSFDGSADLMTAVSQEYNAIPEDRMISMKWTRLVAHANITLKALKDVTAGERVSSITLTAQADANLVGKQKVNILTNVVTNDDDASNVLELNGGNLSIDSDGNVEFWACVLPETLTSLTVVVETDKATYTREITGISKTFKQNARNTLSVKMDGATRVAKEAESWVLVTPADGLSEGTYVLVASTKNQTGALVSTNGSSSAPTFNTSVSVSDNTLNGVTEAMQFDLSGTAENYKLAVTGQTTNYLYTTSANNGVRVGANANNVWTIDEHPSNADAFVFECNATSRFLGVYNDAEWRCYTAYNATNFTSEKGSSQIYLYKKQSGPVVPDTTPKIVVAETEKTIGSEGGDLEFEYTLKNLDGKSLTIAKSDNADFIGVADESGVIVVTVEENKTTSERTATITLSCEGAENVILTVKQSGMVDTNFEPGQYWIMATEEEETKVMTPLAADLSYGYGQSKSVTDNRSYAKNAFTFTKVEDGFTIQDASGRYYYADDTHKSFQLTTESSKDGLAWTVGVQNDGTYIITNIASKRTMKYGDDTFTTFGVYLDSDENSAVYPTLVKADNPLPVELSSISVSGQKTIFNVDEIFEFGGTVTASYTDGSNKDVTKAAVFSGYDMSKTGSQQVAVSYTENGVEKTCEYTIEVTSADSNDKIDVLNRETTGISGTSYAGWSNKTATSSAVYAGQSAGGNNAIQLRTNNNNSGIVTTESGGYVKKVVVTWNSNTTSDRTLNVYGKNSAYSAASDLYDSNAQGTLLGKIINGTSTELEVTGNYQYIGLRSADGAMYLDEIKITWSSEASDAPFVPELAVNPATVEVAAAGGNAEFGYTIIYPADDVSVSASTEATWISGFTYSTANKVTFTVAENTSAEVREAVITLSYEGADSKTVTIKQAAAESSEPETPGAEGTHYVKVTSTPADWSGTYLIVYESSSSAYVYSGVDASNNYISATISDDAIVRSGDLDAVAVTIAQSGTGYSIKITNGTNSGKYISGGTKNGTTFGTTAVANSITLNSDGTVKINNNSTTSLQFNSAKDQMRFRYFSSAQKAVCLYKLN